MSQRNGASRKKSKPPPIIVISFWTAQWEEVVFLRRQTHSFMEACQAFASFVSEKERMAHENCPAISAYSDVVACTTEVQLG